MEVASSKRAATVVLGGALALPAACSGGGGRAGGPGPLAAELGVKPRFAQNDWSTLVPSLERGTFDIALNGLEVTPARAGVVAARAVRRWPGAPVRHP